MKILNVLIIFIHFLLGMISMETTWSQRKTFVLYSLIFLLREMLHQNLCHHKILQTSILPLSQWNLMVLQTKKASMNKKRVKCLNIRTECQIRRKSRILWLWCLSQQPLLSNLTKNLTLTWLLKNIWTSTKRFPARCSTPSCLFCMRGCLAPRTFLGLKRYIRLKTAAWL